MVELKGSLVSIGLPAIVQLIGELHDSGNLELTKGPSRGVLGFDDGRLVAASYDDDVLGLRALTACIVDLVDGDFVFVEGMPAGERTLDLGDAELHELLGRLASGERTAAAPETSSNAPESPRAAVSRAGPPASVVARMAGAAQMQLASPPATRAAGGPVEPEAGKRSASPQLARGVRSGGRSVRRLLPLAIAVVVLAGGLVLAVAALSGRFAQKPASVAATITLPTAAPTAPSELATPTAQSLPETVVPAKPTVATVATAALAPGQPLIDARFASGSKQGWLDNPPYATWSDGAYRLRALQASRFVAVGAPIEQVPSDVVVFATFRKTGGPPGGGYGLVVRNQSPDPLNGVNQNARVYVMETGDLGEFGIWRRDGDQWADLVSWTRSDSVRPGGSPNDLEVRAIGDRLTFSVNGTELAAVQDDTLPSGGVGVFVGGDYNEVALDRFVVQVPN